MQNLIMLILNPPDKTLYLSKNHSSEMSDITRYHVKGSTIDATGFEIKRTAFKSLFQYLLVSRKNNYFMHFLSNLCGFNKCKTLIMPMLNPLQKLIYIFLKIICLQ